MRFSRILLCCLLAIALAASPVRAQDSADNDDSESTDENLVVLNGGGFGHSVGLSQFGAYGRALDGHTYDEILSFYYDNTTLEPITNFKEFDPSHVPESIDVLVGVRNEIAISTPLDELGPGEWELTVEAGGQVIGVSHLPLTTHYDGTRWHAEYTDKLIGVTTDLCDNDSRCQNTALEVVQTIGTRATVEEYEDGDNLGTYAGARYLLHPAAVSLAGSTPDRCGTGRKFCVVVAQLDVEKYLYGLQEVPFDWPIEAMKAQAVAARSYAAATVVNRAASSDWVDEPFNLYDSTADQVFTGWARESGCDWHAWCDAVDATAGEVVVYQAEIEPDEEAETGEGNTETDPATASDEGTDQSNEEVENGDDATLYEPRIAQAFYSSSNGGHTAKPSDVWTGGIDLPFLVPKPDPYDVAFDPQTGRERNPYATWTRSYSIPDLTRWLNNYTVRGEASLKISSLRGIEIERAPESGDVSFATVTVHDADRSVTLTRDGEPYGAWLYFAIVNGCQTSQGCHPPIGTKFVIDFPNLPETEDPPTEDPPTEDPPTEDPPTTDPEDCVNESSDVLQGDYFYESVIWSVCKKLIKGATPELFEPHDEITRAEFAEVLWRFEGSKPPRSRAPFEDVAEDASYRDAVHFLAEIQVTTGTSPTTFSPNMTLSRAQASTFLWRFAGAPVPNLDTTFEDVEDGTYYSEAVRWMVEYGITAGTSATTFSPDDTLTRAAVVTFIWRLAALPEAFAPWLEDLLPDNMRA